MNNIKRFIRKYFGFAQHKDAIILAMTVSAAWILPTACTKDTIPITGVTLNPPSVVLLVDATMTLEAVVEPADATNKTVTWSTSDEAVATVSPSGEVFAVAVGTATITASADNGRFTASCAITVDDGIIHVTGVTLNYSSAVSLLVDKTLYLETTIEPADATNQTVTWSTSDERVATVNPAGEVTAVAPGTATITVTTDDGKFTANCIVTVAPNITMTTQDWGVYFCITIAAGVETSGSLTIDWGDGEVSEIKDAESKNVAGTFCFRHDYSGRSEHRIVIVGDHIKSLGCGENELTALDVSSATELTSLHCDKNRITALDVSRNTALTYLNCMYNQLTALNVSGATMLTRLNCSYNKLTVLDVSRNTAVTGLDCRGNKLTSLDVSLNTALLFLDCSGNQLTALDLSANSALGELCVCYNRIKDLDLSANTELLWFCCMYNKLTASALNDLFRSLPYIPATKWGGNIDEWGNPGSFECDYSIAEEKGWKFEEIHWNCQMTCWEEWDPN